MTFWPLSFLRVTLPILTIIVLFSTNLFLLLFQSNQEKVRLIQELHTLNAHIIKCLNDCRGSNSDARSCDHPYFINTTIVAKNRLEITQPFLAQLEKNPNKVTKVEKRIIGEIGRNSSSSIYDLVQQAKNEIGKMKKKFHLSVEE